MITTIGAFEPVLDMVSTYGPWGLLAQPQGLVPSSATVEGTTTAYFPLSVPTTCTVRRFWWANGATSTGNIIAALYRDAGYKPGAKIGTDTGSTAQGTINQVQFTAPSGGAFVLSPGLWWFALGFSSASTTMFTSNIGSGLDATIKFREATATPPAPATPVESTNGNLYLAGFSTVSSP